MSDLITLRDLYNRGSVVKVQKYHGYLTTMPIVAQTMQQDQQYTHIGCLIGRLLVGGLGVEQVMEIGGVAVHEAMANILIEQCGWPTWDGAMVTAHQLEALFEGWVSGDMDGPMDWGKQNPEVILDAMMASVS